jgi:glycogen synthase
MCELAGEFPANVVCFYGRLPFYSTMMTAADYNCMPSLYEPHGGAFEGLVVPIARAVDGLAEQICPLNPGEAVRAFSDLWHSDSEACSGFLFREPPHHDTIEVLQALLTESPSPSSALFTAMRDALTETLRAAVNLRKDSLRKDDKEKHKKEHSRKEYARLVQAALQRQDSQDWSANLEAMLRLVDRARPVGRGSGAAAAQVG